jgi:hypothetical protein
VFKELLDEWRVNEGLDVILLMNAYKQMWLGYNIWCSFYIFFRENMLLL